MIDWLIEVSYNVISYIIDICNIEYQVANENWNVITLFGYPKEDDQLNAWSSEV